MKNIYYIVNRFSTLLLTIIVLLFSKCSRVHYSYQDAPFLDIDYDTLGRQVAMFTDHEWEVYDEAKKRMNIQKKNELFYTNYKNGAAINISEKLYEEIWEGYDWMNYLTINKLGGIHSGPETKHLLANDLILAIMYNGESSAHWKDSEYKRICRYADRIKKGWRQRGFTLEEADQLVRYFRGEHMQRVLFDTTYINRSSTESQRNIVLGLDNDGNYHALNVLRLDTDPNSNWGTHLRCVVFRLGRKEYPLRVKRRTSNMKYIYINK